MTSEFLKRELQKELKELDDPFNQYRNGYDPRDINGPTLDQDWQ